MKCIICGKEIKKQIWFNQICSDRCFHTNFWNEVLNDTNTLIINGNAYTVGNENSESSFRGYGGEKFVIEKNDGTQITTTNLWHRGEVPKERNIQNNAKFINTEIDELTHSI